MIFTNLETRLTCERYCGWEKNPVPSCMEACPVLEFPTAQVYQMSDRNTFVFKYISLICVQDVYIYIYTYKVYGIIQWWALIFVRKRIQTTNN